MSRSNQPSLFAPLPPTDGARPRKEKEEGAHGLLNPIIVRPEKEGTFTTLAGSRRLKVRIPALAIIYSSFSHGCDV